MSNRLKADRDRYFVPATYLGPKRRDFPVGSLQSRAAARASIAAHAEKQRQEEEAELGNLTPFEQEVVEDPNPRVRYWKIRFLRHAQEIEKVYERPLPWLTLEEFRHNRAVFKEIDRMTGGQAKSLYSGDSTKWNRVRVIAEENLRAEKK